MNERWQHRAQRAQRRHVGGGKAFLCCCRLVISPQLLPQRRRQKRPQLAAGAAEVHGEARLERVAQLAEDDALLVTAELRQRHRRALQRPARARLGR
eukprot:scaffold80296_cov48-Phaeocystis_antarctica.AAC.3